MRYIFSICKIIKFKWSTPQPHYNLYYCFFVYHLLCCFDTHFVSKLASSSHHQRIALFVWRTTILSLSIYDLHKNTQTQYPSHNRAYRYTWIIYSYFECHDTILCEHRYIDYLQKQTYFYYLRSLLIVFLKIVRGWFVR